MDEDLELIKNKKDILDKEHRNIYEGVFFHGELLLFEEMMLFQNRMSVRLPVDFVDMPLKVAKLKYPNENRPDIIKTDLVGATNFTFSLMKAKTKEDEIMNLVTMTKKMIKNYQPSDVFYEDKLGETQSGKYGLFRFKSFALDMPVFNIMYYTIIGGRVMHGIFNCRFDEKEQWEDIAIQVIESIKEVENDEN